MVTRPERRIHYTTDGKGRWVKRVWAEQCPAEVFMTGDCCQGVKGHKGVHWSYSPSGKFCWDDNDEDPQHDGGAGVIPPGNKDYRSPEEMVGQYFMESFDDTEVTAVDVIAMLEKGETPEEGASLSRPFTEKDRGKF